MQRGKKQKERPRKRRGRREVKRKEEGNVFPEISVDTLDVE